MSKVFVQEVLVRGRSIYIYVAKDELVGVDDGSLVGIGAEDEYKIYVSEKPIERIGLEVVKLPSEQSLLSFYPLIYIYGFECIRALDIIIKYSMMLRSQLSQVICFYKGCRKPAKYYAVHRDGLEYGCWYACSEEHFSRKTSKGYPINISEYKRCAH